MPANCCIADLRAELTTDLDFSADGRQFQYRPISQDLVAIDCLCQLLHHIVLADELQVDKDFAESWTEFGQLALLKAKRVARPMPFRYLQTQWEPRRESMKHLLCFCPRTARTACRKQGDVLRDSAKR